MVDRELKKDFVVLGAGMVGVSAALSLVRRGLSVCLVDRSPPGSETSYGNAGVIQSEAVEPYALPRDLGMMIDIILGRSNRVRYHLSALPRLAPSLLGYYRHSNPLKHRAISNTYSRLIGRATSDHEELIEASGAGDLVKREGFRAAYRTEPPFAKDRKNAERLATEYGVGVKFLNGDELAKAEPALLRQMTGAIHWTDSWTCNDPGRLVQKYADYFVSLGGALSVGDAMTLKQSGAGWRVQTIDGWIEASNVVVALGPWSPDLLRNFGYRIQMIRKRGYHRHYQPPQTLNLPLTDVASSAVVSPMKAGLRIATGAELAAFGSSETPVQLQRAEEGVRQIIELGHPVETTPWHGYRPCLPDMLPAVGPAPRHRGMWFNIGHGHQGFTLGPTTAELLAEVITADRQNSDLIEALSPSRLAGC